MARVGKYVNKQVRDLFLDPTARFILGAGSGSGSAGVTTFNGRNGAVTPASNDYTFAQLASKPTTVAGYGITDAASTSGGSYTGTQSYAGNQIYAQGVSSTWYNTTDQVTNFERMRVLWNANSASIISDAGGTGLTRQVQLSSSTSNFITGFTPSGSLGFHRLNAVNSSGSSQVLVSIDGTQTNTGGIITGLAITPNINQSGGSGYRMLWINSFEQAVGSGTKMLIDAGTNSLANGGGVYTSKFSVDNTGLLTAVGGINTGNGNSQSNFGSQGGTAGASSTAAGIQFASSTTNFFRSAFNGVSTTVLTTGANYSNVIIGTVPVTTFTSGTHTWVANAVINSATITNAGATVTNTANLYIGGTPTGGTNNYALYVGGTTNLASPVTCGSSLTVAGAIIAQTTSTFTGVATFTAQDIHNGGININGGEKHKRTVVADAAYTTLATDYLIAYTTLTATRAVTLIAAASVTGQFFIIKDESGNAGTNPITIVGTIDGATNKSISSAYGLQRIYSNGTAYFTW